MLIAHAHSISVATLLASCLGGLYCCYVGAEA